MDIIPELWPATGSTSISGLTFVFGQTSAALRIQQLMLHAGSTQAF
jgi:hypothetical protein